MIGDVIGVGSRVRINDKFGTGTAVEDQEAREFMRGLVGEEHLEEARLELVGKTGTVMCIHSHEAWPYTVLLDTLTEDGDKWVIPTHEEEVDTVDDLDDLAAAIVKESAK